MRPRHACFGAVPPGSRLASCIVHLRALARRSSIRTPSPPRRVSRRTGCIAAHFAATEVAAERLVAAVGNGRDRYVLVSADGRLSVPVRLSIDSVQSAQEPVAGGRLIVDWARATIARGQRKARLSRTELLLLAALLEGNGAPVRRARLVARAWPRSKVPAADRANSLCVYICMLRKRLTGVGLGDVVQTVRGVGYRITL